MNIMKNRMSVCLLALSLGFAATSPGQNNSQTAEPAATRHVLPATTEKTDVPPEVMQQINEETKVPFKYGVVLKGSNGHTADCPNVFRQGDLWYMVHNEFDGYNLAAQHPERVATLAAAWDLWAKRCDVLKKNKGKNGKEPKAQGEAKPENLHAPEDE